MTTFTSPVEDEYATFDFLLDFSFVVSLRYHVTVKGFLPVTLRANSNVWPWLTDYKQDKWNEVKDFDMPFCTSLMPQYLVHFIKDNEAKQTDA
jgi:hypothetical protein